LKEERRKSAPTALKKLCFSEDESEKEPTAKKQRVSSVDMLQLAALQADLEKAHLKIANLEGDIKVANQKAVGLENENHWLKGMVSDYHNKVLGAAFGGNSASFQPFAQLPFPNITPAKQN